MKTEVKRVLDEIESTWRSSACRAIADAITSNPSTDHYAAAFWLLYCDYTVLGTPCFAMNSETHPSASDKYSRWAPPEWEIDVHDCVDELQPLYVKLSALLNDESDEQWEQTIDRHYRLLFRVCKEITNAYHSDSKEFAGLMKNPSFVVGIFEERESEEMYDWLLKNSIDAERLKSAKGIPYQSSS